MTRSSTKRPSSQPVIATVAASTVAGVFQLTSLPPSASVRLEPLNDSLMHLVTEGTVSADEAYTCATDKAALVAALELKAVLAGVRKVG